MHIDRAVWPQFWVDAASLEDHAITSHRCSSSWVAGTQSVLPTSTFVASTALFPVFTHTRLHWPPVASFQVCLTRASQSDLTRKHFNVTWYELAFCTCHTYFRLEAEAHHIPRTFVVFRQFENRLLLLSHFLHRSASDFFFNRVRFYTGWLKSPLFPYFISTTGTCWSLKGQNCSQPNSWVQKAYATA